MSIRNLLGFVSAISLLGLIFTFPAFALQPNEILVIANSRYSHSIELAKYYMKRRNIPGDNLIKLSVTDKEYCDRDEYENDIASPVMDYIKNEDTQRKIRCLLIMYGLPLKILGPKNVTPCLSLFCHGRWC